MNVASRPAFRWTAACHRGINSPWRDESISRLSARKTGATTDDDHLLDPGRLKPREYQDGVEALLRQFRPAIVRYCRARPLMKTGRR